MIPVVFLLLTRIRAITIRNCFAESSTVTNTGILIYICSYCRPGYLIDSNKHCDKCDEENGYYQDTSALEFTCKKYTCTDGYDHCTTCKDDLTCSTCDEGYDLVSTSKMTNCFKCASGYEQDKSSDEFTCVKITCTNGENHCMVCNQDGINCDYCYIGYKSSSKEFKVCDSCATDYTRENIGNDFTCTPVCNIEKCEECYLPNRCGKCINGYKPSGLSENECRLDCTGQIERCRECSTTEDGTYECYKCDSGFELIDQSRCDPLPYKCYEGDSKSQTCTQCNTGYYLLSDSCHPCPTELNCGKCGFKEGTTDLECIDYCDNGYYYKDGKCLNCPNIPNCMSCTLVEGSDEPICRTCELGYNKDENNECKKCPDNFSGCGEYKWCNSGFYLDNDQCKPCSIDNCNDCELEEESQSVICSLCNRGFELSEDEKSCSPCQFEHCTICSDGKCHECEDGYYTTGGNCIPCPLDKHCSTCHYDNTYDHKVYCTTCPEGYYYNIGKCIACSNDCSKCYPTKDDIICLECNKFSDINDGKCIAKSCTVEGMSGCSKCRTDGTIKECISCEDPNYEIAEDKLSCKPKPCDVSLIAYCESCKIDGEQKICTECSKGYTLSFGGKECLECSSIDNCATCETGTDENHPLKCLSCTSGYELIEETGLCTKPQPKPTSYQVCIDFSAIPQDYSFGYTSQEIYENDDIHSTNNGKLNVTYNHQFKLSLYLTKSPNCEEKELLSDYYSKTTSAECSTFTLENIPEKCKKPDEDQSSDIMIPEPTPIKTPSITSANSTIKIEDSSNFNSALIDEFKELNKEQADVKIVKIDSKVDLDFNSELSSDQFIQITNNGKINYNNGNLGLVLDDQRVELAINDNENSKIRLFGNGEINLKLPETDDSEKKVSIDFKEKSTINGHLKINVPKNVESLKIDSIDLSSNAQITAINDDNKDVTINVNNLEAAALTNSELKNMIIEKSLKIVQSASLKFENVNFDKNAKVEYQIYNFGDWDLPMFQGNLNQKPNNIVLLKPDGDELPQNDKPYSLIRGIFKNSKCEDWANSIELSNSGFNFAECIPKTYGKLLQSDTQEIALKRIENPPNPPKESGGSNKGMIIGIVVGVVVVVAIIVIVVVVVILKKRKNNDNSSEGENADQTENV